MSERSEFPQNPLCNSHSKELLGTFGAEAADAGDHRSGFSLAAARTSFHTEYTPPICAASGGFHKYSGQTEGVNVWQGRRFSASKSAIH